ncbi:hypothetical protein ACHRVW_16460 [Flavobacterium collinsii]|jgi:hypothetical protein|uniref:Lipocalin-like domain-containing protein n=1 Tax=Flavobacterium collinsii TaxID=1114861 RepID=A0ABM9SF79_9FLAO|nr:hypothetical protein [Flavobacterium collinsii]GIQ57743.1 hypothetical protein Flavo103_08790 [Flavobacterium collinsii]CAA9195556.1 hypothetical protein FLACOL7796_00676 [Flavobacterium collinsii]
MIKTLLSFLLSFFIFNGSQAQTVKSILYKGTIDGKTAVTFYIKAENHPCNANLMYTSMYRYDKSGNWIQLNTTQNKKNKREFVFVEQGFTGVMILEKDDTTFNGLWISPDAKKQLKTELKKVPMTAKDIEFYEDKMEKVNYENNDC